MREGPRGSERANSSQIFVWDKLNLAGVSQMKLVDIEICVKVRGRLHYYQTIISTRWKQCKKWLYQGREEKTVDPIGVEYVDHADTTTIVGLVGC